LTHQSKIIEIKIRGMLETLKVPLMKIPKPKRLKMNLERKSHNPRS
jgi:hypothetical protein